MPLYLARFSYFSFIIWYYLYSTILCTHRALTCWVQVSPAFGLLCFYNHSSLWVFLPVSLVGVCLASWAWGLVPFNNFGKVFTVTSLKNASSPIYWWWVIPLIPALVSQRQADCWVRGQPGYIEKSVRERRGWGTVPLTAVTQQQKLLASVNIKLFSFRSGVQKAF